MPTSFIVTTGHTYTEIDGYACSVALNELLLLQGKVSTAVLPGILNQSVSDSVRRLGAPISTTYPKDQFDQSIIIVDVSDPNFLAKGINLKNVVELYDHHFGFEKYWQEKLGDKTVIEPVGACATLIWERFKAAKLGKQISPLSASLLTTAIISNTLNLQASVTTSRDIQAISELAPYTNLPEKWTEIYFTEVEEHILKDVPSAIKNDTKIQEIPNLKQTFVIGQIELWDGEKFVRKHQREIKTELAANHNPLWFLTTPSISQGINYLYTENEEVKQLLEKVIGAKFDKNIGTTDKLWLRKEILREFQKL